MKFPIKFTLVLLIGLLLIIKPLFLSNIILPGADSPLYLYASSKFALYGQIIPGYPDRTIVFIIPAILSKITFLPVLICLKIMVMSIYISIGLLTYLISKKIFSKKVAILSMLLVYLSSANIRLAYDLYANYLATLFFYAIFYIFTLIEREPKIFNPKLLIAAIFSLLLMWTHGIIYRLNIICVPVYLYICYSQKIKKIFVVIFLACAYVVMLHYHGEVYWCLQNAFLNWRTELFSNINTFLFYYSSLVVFMIIGAFFSFHKSKLLLSMTFFLLLLGQIKLGPNNWVADRIIIVIFPLVCILSSFGFWQLVKLSDFIKNDQIRRLAIALSLFLVLSGKLNEAIYNISFSQTISQSEYQYFISLKNYQQPIYFNGNKANRYWPQALNPDLDIRVTDIRK